MSFLFNSKYDEFGNFIGDVDEDNDDSEDVDDARIETKQPQSPKQLSVQRNHSVIPFTSSLSGASPSSTLTSEDVFGDDVDIVYGFDDIAEKRIQTNETLTDAFEGMKRKQNSQKITMNSDTTQIHEVEDSEDTLVSSIPSSPLCPSPSFDFNYYKSLLRFPSKQRIVAFAGNLHHGKTTLTDLFFHYSHHSLPFVSPHSSLFDSHEHPHRPWTLKYLDEREDEKQREISVKSHPFSLLAEDLSGMSFVLHAVDCPGHIDFSDERDAIFRAVDSVVLVVDVAEGALISTEKIVLSALREGLDIILFLNKMDRMVIDLKLPPTDLYFKLVTIIDHINDIIRTQGGDMDRYELSPIKGNVIFGSALHGYAFTLTSFSQQYYYMASQKASPSSHWSDFSPSNPSVREFSLRLWGNIYFNESNRKFTTQSFVTKEGETAERTFIQFVLKPLYKIYSHTLSRDPQYSGWKDTQSHKRTKEHYSEESLQSFLSSLNISLSASQLSLPISSLLKFVLHSFFSPYSVHSIVEAITKVTDGPDVTSQRKVGMNYGGSRTNRLIRHINGEFMEEDGDVKDGGDEKKDSRRSKTAFLNESIALQSNPLHSLSPLASIAFFHISKQYIFPSYPSSLLSYGRMYSGILRVGDEVRVMGDHYSESAVEDCAIKKVTRLFLPMGRHLLEVKEVSRGNLVLIEGLDESISKAATVVANKVRTAVKSSSSPSFHPIPNDVLSSLSIFRPLTFSSISALKVAIEPHRPSDLPRLLDSLRRIDKLYPLSVNKIEPSGEYILMAPGELYMDCVLNDLRHHNGASIEVKVSDPMARLSETIVSKSLLPCSVVSQNKKNRLAMVAEPLDEVLSMSLLHKDFPPSLLVPPQNPSDPIRTQYFQSHFNFDILSARSIWTVSPSQSSYNNYDYGTNILIDETMKDEENEMAIVESCRDSIVQGFDWAVREGPLIEENVRNCKFRLVDSTLAVDMLHRSRGQIIPLSKKIVQGTLLLSQPRLLEPIYGAEVITPTEFIPAISKVLQRRRGILIGSQPLVGSPLSVVRCEIPLMDSFGFEVDLRVFTRGQSFPTLFFDHHALVPGNPLDKTIHVRPLQPQPTFALAREYFVKTRRRKGMNDEIQLNHFFDEGMILRIAEKEVEIERENQKEREKAAEREKEREKERKENQMADGAATRKEKSKSKTNRRE